MMSKDCEQLSALTVLPDTSVLPPSVPPPPAHKGHPLAAETDRQKKGPGTRPGPRALHAPWIVHHIHAAHIQSSNPGRALRRSAF